MKDNLLQLQLNFNEDSLFLLNLSLAFIMFGVALGLERKKFVEVARNPRGVITGFVSQFILLPAFTYLLIIALKPLPGLAMGMILVAACPGGNVSNFFSKQAGGNVALSISLTGIATLSAVFLTPFNFEFWSDLYVTHKISKPIDLEFWKLAKTVLLLLVLPLVAGIWFSSRFKKTTRLIERPIRNISFLILVGFIVIAFLNNLQNFADYYQYILLIVFLHNGMAFILGYLIAKINRLPLPDRKTISIETGIQNSGLALVIVFNFFEGNGGMALVAAWWGIWHIISGSAVSWFYAKNKLINPANNAAI